MALTPSSWQRAQIPSVLHCLWTGYSIPRKHTWSSASSDCATEKSVFTTFIHVLSVLFPNLPPSCCILGYFFGPFISSLPMMFKDGFIKYISQITCTPSVLKNHSQDLQFYTQKLGDNVERSRYGSDFQACQEKILRTKVGNGRMMSNKKNSVHSPAVIWPV